MTSNFQSRPYVSGQPQPQNLSNGPIPTPVVLPQPRVLEKNNIRVLCVADVRGDLNSLNTLAKKANADYIIHTGDFGFYDDSSLERIAEKTLRHVAQYSPILTPSTKAIIQSTPASGPPIKTRLSETQAKLSQLPQFLDKTYSFDVPVYTVWGACEDVRVLEKFRSGEYKVDKLHIIDESSSRLLDIGGIKLRLLGLGGAVVMHKLFDNGEGKTTIAGGQGTMWTTLLQMGELVDTANRVYDPAETRVFITHSSPAREGLLNQLSVTLKADFSISAGLHFRYGSSYNEFSVNPTLDHYRGKLAASKASFNDVWETVKNEVTATVAQNDAQQRLLDNALTVVDKMPTSATGPTPFGGPAAPGAKGEVDESAFKNMWNFNLADAAFGMLILEIEGGRIGTEMRAQGFNFAHRTGKANAAAAAVAANNSSTGATTSPAMPAAPVTTSASAPPSQPPANAPKAQPPTSAQPAQPPQAQSQSQQPPIPNVPSPAPRATDPIKPATPLNPPLRTGSAGPKPQAATKQPSQPQESSSTTSTDTNKKEVSQNGTKPAAPVTESKTSRPDQKEGTAQSAKSATPPPATDKTSSPSRNGSQRNNRVGIFISTMDDKDAVKELFNESDRALIEDIALKQGYRGGNKYCYVYFKDTETAEQVLSRMSAEIREGRNKGQPHAKMMDADSRPSRFNQAGRGRGDFHRSSASESEGQGSALGEERSSRGSGRGYDRGDRGRGRGFGDRGRGRGKRGGFKSEGGDGAAPSSSSTTPAAPSKPAES